jgi:hypothetical protein
MPRNTMNPRSMIALAVVAVTVSAACSDSGPAVAYITGPTQPASTLVSTVPPETSSPAITASAAAETTPPQRSTSTPTASSVDEAWRDAAASWCDRVAWEFFAISEPTSPDDLARFVEDHHSARDELLASSANIDLPPELLDGPYDIAALVSSADEWMTRALDQVAAGNVDGDEFSDSALGSIDHFLLTIRQIFTVYAIAGVPCGVADPARTVDAELNVPIPAAWQVSTGFDSVWVSDRANRQIHRIDPDTGEIEAVIDVGSTPYRLQPADGRMVVRTADAYELIDPATNSVAATLLKSDVGPAANRAWAVDGALWICDGERLHRYDPATLQAITTIDLGFVCGNVHATDDLVIPWTYNEDEGESGMSIAAFVHPESNSVLATIDLPVDVGKPTVVNEIVFFPATEGSTSIVVDRTTGTIVATPDLGRPYVHSNDSMFDGTHLYVMVNGRDIAVVDPATFEIVDTIEPMDFDPPLGVQINALTLSPGALWVVNDESSILQRFDLDTTPPGAVDLTTGPELDTDASNFS